MKIMKKHSAYTAMILAALMFTGCGDAASTAERTEDVALNSAKAEYEYADSAEASAEASSEAGAAAADFSDDVKMAEEAADEGEAYLMMDDATCAEMPLEAAPDIADGEEPSLDIEPEPEPDINNGAEPFVLTAGEWSDNENWGFFANLVHNGTIEFPSYGLNPVYRVAVTVTNGGAAVQNQTVQLKADDVLWTAKTDKNGKAYLFYDESCAGQSMIIETADADAVTFTAPEIESGQGGSSVPVLEYTMETSAASQTYSETEVCFILDTTGSMGDEITYLQKDFSAIAEEVAAEGVTFSVNFYRDEGDAYVTRCNPFTDDVKAVQQTLNQEFADGGGDTPEAVAEILDEVMTKGDWHDHTNKIAFLIFDAPPHNGTAQADMIRNAIAAAAEQGIHVVPVVASNAERDTELFGRALAIMTNGNYVFLTDDSGVGESHLEPIIGDYDVELLHDIIVRNILEIAA